MFDFCHHCGQTIGGQAQVVGKMLVCQACGKEIGVVKAAPEKVVIDRTEEILQGGTAARCPACNQVVELKTSGTTRSFVPHFLVEKRRVCPGSGKPVAPPTAPPAAPPAAAKPQALAAPGKKDLSAYMNREVIRVVACAAHADPTIEELNLEYLDKADRVRLQIEALRDILGKTFQIKPYPATLNRPNLGIWGNATCCVIATKHDKGGYQPMSSEDIQHVVADLRQHKSLFFS